jgi:hypothetical protein
MDNIQSCKGKIIPLLAYNCGKRNWNLRPQEFQDGKLRFSVEMKKIRD